MGTSLPPRVPKHSPGLENHLRGSRGSTRTLARGPRPLYPRKGQGNSSHRRPHPQVCSRFTPKFPDAGTVQTASAGAQPSTGRGGALPIKSPAADRSPLRHRWAMSALWQMEDARCERLDVCDVLGKPVERDTGEWWAGVGDVAGATKAPRGQLQGEETVTWVTTVDIAVFGKTHEFCTTQFHLPGCRFLKPSTSTSGGPETAP